MRVGLDWGREHVEVEVAAENLVALQRAASVPALVDPVASMRNALEEPFDFPPLRRALTPDDQVVIGIDEQVPQLARLLVPILDQIHAAGVAFDAITLLCLPPTTGQPWLEELPDEFADVRVEVHQPRDRRKLSYLATTKQGRRVYINRSAVDADQLILLTRRVYDPVLGYAGGETMLYPGLSDEATLQETGVQLHIEPPVADAWLVQREAAEVAWLLGAPFLVQIVEGTDRAIANIVSGTAKSSVEGRRLLDARWRVTTDRLADVVVAGVAGDPARLTSDDLARAFFAAMRVVRPGGRIALLTEGAPAFGRSFDLLRQSDDAGVGMKLLLKERPADLTAGFMWASAARHARLYLLSGTASDVVEELFATPLESAAEVQRLLGAHDRCVFLPDAHQILATVAK